jgi:flagellar biosynthesis/type III secretory pathway protein FliH
MSVVSEVAKIAYDEGVEHGNNEGYGQGYEAGKNCIVAGEGNYNDGWLEGYKAASNDLANGRPNQLEPPPAPVKDIPF